MTATVTTFQVPADARAYTVRSDVRADYSAGNALLVRVDSRRTSGGYVHTYAPIILIDGVPCVDAANAFSDCWGEVVPA